MGEHISQQGLICHGKPQAAEVTSCQRDVVEQSPKVFPFQCGGFAPQRARLAGHLLYTTETQPEGGEAPIGPLRRPKDEILQDTRGKEHEGECVSRTQGASDRFLRAEQGPCDARPPAHGPPESAPGEGVPSVVSAPNGETSEGTPHYTHYRGNRP